MDRMMDSPWFLRIIALTLAVLLFVSVKTGEGTSSSTSGTQIDVLRDVPVEVYYDDENSVVTGVPETVTVNIEGPTQVVLSAKMMKDYKLFIDLRKLTYGEHRVAISSENFSDKLKVRIDPVYVDVNIEEKISKEFRVDPEMNEGLLAENYIVKSYEVEPKMVTITGAKSIINSIGYVKATIVGDPGITKSFDKEASVRVLDRDLNKLDVIVDPKQVQVKVNIEEHSKEVPIVLRQKGSPKQDVTINGLTTNVETIRLFGPRNILDRFNQLTVDVDISKLEKSGDLDVKLAIPDGVTRMSLDKIKVTADVTPAPVTEPPAESPPAEEETKEESVPTDSEKSFEQVAVEVRGLSDELASDFKTPTNGLVTVTAKGTREELDKINKSNIALYVEAQNAKVGENTFPIKMDAPTDVQWEMSASEVKITVKEA
ncbi:CdaR family protein [Psychrobacillus sp. FJAT-51614]|uniref:CdaR family protein n=1 Tax=Psychrobacillus mangrovi TaxID=3117745 RepID=A0ABU8F6F6_9BACI